MSLATPSDVYFKDYSAEIYFLSVEDDKTLFHRYISYDMGKIKGHFGTEDYCKFRMKAWADVPLSYNEILRLKVYMLRNNEIEDFTVQYEARLDGNKRKTFLPLKSGYSYQDVDKIIFRSDYGHVDSARNKLKHTNVEILNSRGIKINEDQSSFIIQDFEIPNYERAIHYVLMQAEKPNPLVGALYWISPFNIHTERAEYLSEVWNKSSIMTPLCIVARNVNICIIKKVYGNDEKEILDEDFQSLVNDEIHSCKQFEERNPDDIRLYQLDPMPNDYWYPFPFFKPDDNAIYGSDKIDENGNTQEITDHREIGLVNEQLQLDGKTSRY